MNFTLQNNNTSTMKTLPNITYAIRSIYNGATNYLSMGMLPMKNKYNIRPGNIVTKPNNDIWKLKKDGPTYKQYFHTAFPRIFNNNNDNSSIQLNDNEWERFAKENGTKFPYCQYVPRSSISSISSNANNKGLIGVALVGDACTLYYIYFLCVFIYFIVCTFV